MTEQELEAIKQHTRASWAKVRQGQQAPAGTFRHFASQAEWEAHRQGVKQDQQSGIVPF